MFGWAAGSRRGTAWLVLLGVLLVSCGSDGASGEVCGEPVESGLNTIECDGIAFDVSIPEVCLDESCGVIIDVHGDDMTGEWENDLTSMRELGNAAGYIVVHPNGPGGRWPSLSSDAAAIRAFVDDLLVATDGDRNRVHVGGASMGGIMTWHLVCDHADLIASAAPLAAGIGCEFDDVRSPSAEVDVLVFHGVTDYRIYLGTARAQRDLAIDAWVMMEQDPIADEADYRWLRWMSHGGTELQFIEFEWEGVTGGHCVPGADGRGGCGADNPVDYGEAALAFYIAHPKDG
jgi:poly(3-hydroxybutyrate) depolymerase